MIIDTLDAGGDHVVTIADEPGWSGDPVRASCRCGWTVTGDLSEVEPAAEIHVAEPARPPTKG